MIGEIQNLNMRPFFNVQSFATGKRRLGFKVPRFHLLDVASTNRDMQSTRDETGQTLRWLTNGSSHLKLHNWVFLWHRDNALPIVEWAGNLLHALVWEIFMEQRQLRHESIVLALLFSRAEIISFSTEFSSLTEVRQLLSEGPSLNSWQPPRNDNIFQTIHDWRSKIETLSPTPQKERMIWCHRSWKVHNPGAIVELLTSYLGGRALAKAHLPTVPHLSVLRKGPRLPIDSQQFPSSEITALHGSTESDLQKNAKPRSDWSSRTPWTTSYDQNCQLGKERHGKGYDGKRRKIVTEIENYILYNSTKALCTFNILKQFNTI